ncbi:MAG TPA: hypothetical protein VNO43_11210 [Candidatus Eisenbacteria bacterium]|nr:hypothetical protein [Candidatus Eisenbacteria bacterium]
MQGPLFRLAVREWGSLLEDNMPAVNKRSLGQLEGENVEERIEVIARENPGEAPMLEVRALRWGSGVGWYPHKTLVLTSGQALRLAHLLRRFSATARRGSDQPKIIPLRKRSR